MEKVKLPVIEVAKCCGTCEHHKHPDKKWDQPGPHAAHYEVSKTERWCFLHSMPTAREGVCPDHKMLDKLPFMNRIRKQVSRMEKIHTIVQNLQGTYTIRNIDFYVEGSMLRYKYNDWNFPHEYWMSCKVTRHDKQIEEILKHLEKTNPTI